MENEYNFSKISEIIISLLLKTEASEKELTKMYNEMYNSNLDKYQVNNIISRAKEKNPELKMIIGNLRERQKIEKKEKTAEKIKNAAIILGEHQKETNENPSALTLWFSVNYYPISYSTVINYLKIYYSEYENDANKSRGK